MSYKSKAQQRFMHAAEERGEIPKKTVDEYDKKTDFKHLPERVKKKKNMEKKATRDEIIDSINETLRSKHREDLMNQISRGI